MINFDNLKDRIPAASEVGIIPSLHHQENIDKNIEPTLECQTDSLSFYFDEMKISKLSASLKALGDPIRLKLVLLMMQNADGAACVCNLNQSVDISQPTLSHHLKILKDAEVVKKSKKGTWAYYSVNPEILKLVNLDSLKITEAIR